VRWGIVSAVMMAGSDKSSWYSVEGDWGCDADRSRGSCSGMLGIRVEALVIWDSACGEGIVEGGNESIFWVQMLCCTIDRVIDRSFLWVYGGKGGGTVI
jgi:hypothetical protein